MGRPFSSLSLKTVSPETFLIRNDAEQFDSSLCKPAVPNGKTVPPKTETAGSCCSSQNRTR